MKKKVIDIHVRLPFLVHRGIAERATAARRPLNSEIIVRLERSLAEDDSPPENQTSSSRR